MVKTVDIVGTEIKVEDLGGQNVAVKNLGSGSIYVSTQPNITAGADNVIEIPAGAGEVVLDANGTVYIVGTGKVQCTGTPYATPNFKLPSSSSGGGGGTSGVTKEYVDAQDTTNLNLAKAYTDNAKSEIQTTIDTVNDTLNTHIADQVKHITAAEREAWNAKADLSDIPTELPANGGNADTVNGHTVESDVPANAKFTDTKVTNTLAKTTKAYVTGTTSSSTNTGTQVFDTGVYLDTTEGQIVATTFKGALSGNASTATALTSSAGNSGKPIYFSKGKPVVCSTIITVRAGALPTTQSSSSSITLSYLSNYSKATIFVYMNQRFDDASAVTANRVIDAVTLTGISSSMTAISYYLSGGSNTGCNVSISSAGIITLTVPVGKSYHQAYIAIYYN